MPNNWTMPVVVAGVLLAGAVPASYGYVQLTIRSDLGTFPELRAFAEIAFGTETGFGGNENRVSKWTDRIAFATSGDTAASAAGYIGSYFDTLAGLTGLDIAPVGAGGPEANFHIRSLAGADVDRLISGGGWQPHTNRFLRRFAETDMPCIFVAKTEDGRIDRADILLKEGISASQAEACLQEEVAQALGLPNDTDTVSDTVFSDENGVMQLTPLDESLLRLLYLDEIEPGMSRTLALYRLGRHLKRQTTTD